ncbi:MAG: hypothetical protein DMF79_14820, partial [Acidobacteria bacterium]
GQFLAHYGARSEALKLADRAIESDPGQALAHEVRGRVLATQGRRREALVELTRAAELAPRDFIVHYRLGVTALPHEDEAERSRRERSLRKAIELQPGYAPAHNALAALIQPKDAEEAVKHARTAGAIEPSETSHVLRLAGAQRAAGRVAEADTIELGLVRAAQGDSRLLTEITWYFRNEGRPADAEALLRRVRTARPDLVRATILLASMLAQEKKYDEAEALYREALRAQPEDPSLLNSLGYMNADRSLRVPEALELIEKALRKRPDEPSFLDSRGWTYFRLGRPAEAERDLRKAIGQGADAVMLDHLGDVLAARGAREEAIASWREALEQEDISDELRGSIEAKLAQADKSRQGSYIVMRG